MKAIDVSHTPDNEQQAAFYEHSYDTAGFGAQRRYPNEELCRFMGRNFFSVPKAERDSIRILETGCGSGANLWMIAREGFDTYGIDLAEAGISLCQRMLATYDCNANLKVGDMTQTGYESDMFHAVVDVFSSNCLTKADGVQYLSEMSRILTPGGKFFSYFPSKKSDTWTLPNHPDPTFQQKLDSDTLNGLHRPDGPFCGNTYAFRFQDKESYSAMLADAGLDVSYMETVGRSYRDGAEYFEFLIVEAIKH